MKSVSQARATFLTIALIFLVLDVICAVVLMTPAGRSPAERSKEYEELRQERMQKEAETRPTRDMDKKLVMARESIGAFYQQHLPVSYSDVSEDLGKVAVDHHVNLAQVRYASKPSSVQTLNAVGITINVVGDYRAMMEFINALERDKRFYVIDKVLIQDSGTSNQVRVEIELETFLRNS